MENVSVIVLDSDDSIMDSVDGKGTIIKKEIKQECSKVISPRKPQRNCDSKGKRKISSMDSDISPAKKVKVESVKCEKTEVKKELQNAKNLVLKTEKELQNPSTTMSNLKIEKDSLSASTSKENNSTKHPVKTNEQKNGDWEVEDVISEKLQMDLKIVKNVVRLFKADNTIPFIARYRKEETGSMEPEMLRRLKDKYDRLLAVKNKIESVASSITKMNKMTPSVMDALRSSQSMNEIEHVYAQFKTAGVKSKAERARALGLESEAIAILNGHRYVNPEKLINEKTESLTNVMLGLQHIIADIISKNKTVLDECRNLCENSKNLIFIETKRVLEKGTKSKKESDNKNIKKEAKNEKVEEEKKKKVNSVKANESTAEKFETYFSFKATAQSIKPHQYLAICRGESLKVLSVKVILHEKFSSSLRRACTREWYSRGKTNPFRTEMLDRSFEDSFTRLLQPHMVRYIRSYLLDEAHLASIEVFAQNLKHLLLTPPVRGEVILGIDPGYRHGCKLAVVNANGEVLATDVVYIHSGRSHEHGKLLRKLLLDHNCELIALGNGTACRETELWIGSLIYSDYFKPLKIKYTIVDEQGVSIYSCSPVAKEEFPNMDPNLISAVSLARRVQDPLSELVKVQPKHLGVGMYQHDIPEKKLSSSLDEVVMECVSFVGVDVNTASSTLLRHVAGLNITRATNIIEWRSRNGPFLNRDQLHEVKGLGPKSFEQSAGFLRILSKTSSQVCFGDLKEASTSKSKKKTNVATDKTPNPLDQTWIHPESYSATYWFLELCGVTLAEFGSPEFVNKIQHAVMKMGLKSIASQVNVSEEKLTLIVEGLLQKPEDDLRSKFQKPLFRSSISTVNDLKPGTLVTGRVQNVTHFGAFVDVGVGHDGLMHISKMHRTPVNVGDHVEVRIVSVNTNKKKVKINLELYRVLI